MNQVLNEQIVTENGRCPPASQEINDVDMTQTDLNQTSECALPDTTDDKPSMIQSTESNNSLASHVQKSKYGRIIRKNARYLYTKYIHQSDRIKRIALITTKVARDKYGERVVQESMLKELKSLLDNNTWEIVPPNKLTPVQWKGVINCHMHLTEKLDSDGNMTSLKARLVANGSTQPKTNTVNEYVESNASPTVHFPNLMLNINIGTHEKRHFAAFDVKSAFLHADISNSDVYVRLPPTVANLLASIDHKYKNMTTHTGAIIVRLKKALYGLRESPMLWFLSLSNTLKQGGYVQSKYDPCVFYQLSTKRTVVIHVDDLLAMMAEKHHLDDLQKLLEDQYGKVNRNEGNNLQYLKMKFEYTRNDGKLLLSQIGNIKDLVAKHVGESYTPVYTPSDSTIHDEDKTPDVDTTKYKSLVMSLQYLASATRPDIQTAVAYLNTFCESPTQKKMDALTRIVRYLATTIDTKLEIKPSSTIMNAYTDASFASHTQTRRSHTGYIITLGGQKGFVYSKSGRQEHVTRSSAESELVALDACSRMVAALRYMLLEQGYHQPPTIINVDNKSTICMTWNGKGEWKRSRHIDIQWFYTHELASFGVISPSWIGTEDNVADLFTKHMYKDKFINFRKYFMTN
jgi:hypothetical protein